MYVALLVLLTALGGALTANGVQWRRPKTLFIGSFILLLTVLFFGLLSFWGEMLWFEELGQSSRFWTVVFAQSGFTVLGALVGGLGVLILTLPIPVQTPLARVWAMVAGALSGGLWGFWNWQILLKYIYQVATGIRDPILQRDTGFYLFTLPFYDSLYWGLLWTAAIALAAAVRLAMDTPSFNELLSEPSAFANPSESGGAISAHRFFWLPLAAITAVVAWGQYLKIYHLLYSRWGVVVGAGWTDVHVRLPAYLIAAAATLLLGLLPLVPAVYRRVAHRFRRLQLPVENAALIVIGVPWLGIFAVWFLALGVAPLLAQWLRVQPNEITLESPYIAHNIEFTRRGFQLHNVEEREFAVSPAFTKETVSRNQYLLSEVRLWDWRALEAVYKQFQEIRLYYEFADVDVDRYHMARGYRQVMLSAREMEPANLPVESRTFVNLRFKYTHGYGLVMAPVSDFTADGLPNFLIKDIPPRTDDEKLRVTRPQIYYGELTDSHVFVNTSEPEFDYPSGAENVYVRYSGVGGVQISNLWRKFLFGWKFDGTRFLLSSYPTSDSRVLFHREIRERVKTLAPFLNFDTDPYVVLVDGHIYWIIDAYTTSTYYPYSEPFSPTEPIEFKQSELKLAHGSAASLAGANYVRNSVKAVVDAFNGSVTFYVFEPEDPLIRVWQRIFPELFTAREKMPEALRAHVRYPRDFLLTQGLVYAKYHMTDPAVFYNQEDLWVRATEKYYAEVQPLEPYYIMWQPPGSKSAEFILMLPFTPKNRQVMIGWIAGMCDPANYGRLLAYKFPKEERILGPQQVDTKIDQDGFLSGQLSLWNQQGSRVIRGDTLVIPIDNSLLYVEPIYLQAEAAAYPELRLVAVMYGDNLSYAETFDKALQGLLTEAGKKPPPALVLGLKGKKIPFKELVSQANEAFKNYLRLQGEGRFVEAAKELTRLQESLQQLAKQLE
jgi:uncharacterized membrane protein (UPF0182 family)